ncbi:transcription cofactor vestigial-like protein 1 isoform X2 [Athene noctua]|uniref:transcription cofactor vestigial-like protein 1 isoform X2 n=1 Tax=Athene noctua TaxID=126797 RepID=UPI003EBB0059
MEETRKLSPKPCKNKEPVKTEWGSQSVVFTYFQGDINSVVDEHFSRALSNAKNPQDLSTKHKGETVVLKNGQYQPSALRSHPTQPADLWPFPSIGTPSLTSSVYHHALPDLHTVDEPISDRKYGSLLGLLQQERCLTSMQECTMKQHSSSACMTGPARLQNISQSSAPGGERKASSYQGSENPSVSHATAGIQIHDRRRDLYF